MQMEEKRKKKNQLTFQIQWEAGERTEAWPLHVGHLTPVLSKVGHRHHGNLQHTGGVDEGPGPRRQRHTLPEPPHVRGRQPRRLTLKHGRVVEVDGQVGGRDLKLFGESWSGKR